MRGYSYIKKPELSPTRATGSNPTCRGDRRKNAEFLLRRCWNVEWFCLAGYLLRVPTLTSVAPLGTRSQSCKAAGLNVEWFCVAGSPLTTGRATPPVRSDFSCNQKFWCYSSTLRHWPAACSAGEQAPSFCELRRVNPLARCAMCRVRWPLP